MPPGSPLASAIVARVRYAPAFRQPTHADDAIQISLVLQGELVERVGRADESAGPLSWVVKARGVEHADVYGPHGALLCNLALRGDAAERLLDDPARLPAWCWTHGVAAIRPFFRLLDRLTGPRMILPDDDPDLLSVLAAVTARDAGPSGAGPPDWLRRLRERLNDEPDVRAGAAARDVGVHPVYLARCFRRWYGCSVATYLTQVRVRRAAALLHAHSRTLARTACDAGFSDQAHFNHRFREAAGMTPGRFRALSSWSAAALDAAQR